MSARHLVYRFPNTVANILPSAADKACGPLPGETPERSGLACTASYEANPGGTFRYFWAVDRLEYSQHPRTNVGLCTWASAKPLRQEMA